MHVVSSGLKRFLFSIDKLQGQYYIRVPIFTLATKDGKDMARAVWNDMVLAESDKYKMVEGNVYFPPGSVKWDYLKPSDRQYTCPWKGITTYYDIVVGEEVQENSAWSYPEPKEAAKYIKGYVAFETGFFGKGVQVKT